jgi:SAM-dependent methyltransferase
MRLFNYFVQSCAPFIQFFKNILRPIKKKLLSLFPYKPETKMAAWLVYGTDPDHFPIDNEKKFKYNPLELPVPNYTLRFTSGPKELDNYLYIGAAWATICNRYLSKKSRSLVLDIGCGVGKTARFLILNPLIDYCGFDIFLPSIVWCRREFPRIVGDSFRFEHFDGFSETYNPDGKTAATDYKFPVEDGKVDLAFAASLFTHLLEKDMRHYLNETNRVLKPGGVAVFSIHTLEDLKDQYPNTKIENGKNYIGNEHVMFIRKQFFIETAIEFGLSVKEEIGKICGQETIVFEKI